MVSSKVRTKRRILKVTEDNYQTILLEVLRTNNVGNLKMLSIRAAEAGIADGKIVERLSDAQWEIVLHKLRSVNPSLKEEERQSSKDWCLTRGIFPGGHFAEEKEIE